MKGGLYSLVCAVLIFDMLKVAQAALIDLHGVQFWCPHTRSCLRKPVCAGKPAVKFARVNGPLWPWRRIFTPQVSCFNYKRGMHLFLLIVNLSHIC